MHVRYHFMFSTPPGITVSEKRYVFVIVSRVHICKLFPSACPQLNVICQVNMTQRNKIKLAAFFNSSLHSKLQNIQNFGMLENSFLTVLKIV